MAYTNRSAAVMAQRNESKDSLDYYPTPPWATRALCEYVLGGKDFLKTQSVLEPACGMGHMAFPLEEYFNEVISSDIHDYGFGDVQDFLKLEYETGVIDWVITNPPFTLAEEFINKALRIAVAGVAMLTRTTFLEGVGRYKRLFKDNPPAIVAPFCERVPMLKGRLDKNASSATSYAWLIWIKPNPNKTEVQWISPCRKELELDADYAT